MSGKLCSTYTSNDVLHSRCYCEGRNAAAGEALVGTNPHPDGSEEATAWEAGFDSWEADPAGGNAQGRDCCADPFGGGYVAP